MRLLYITQKLHGQDVFIVQWIQEFVRQGYSVHVLCLEWRQDSIEQALGTTFVKNFEITSLGKEQGTSKLQQIFTFWKAICTLRYDRVFLHLNTIWGLLGAWYWIPKRMPVYTWYTHYMRTWSIWLLGKYGKRFFCATAQSLPQFMNHPKKIVTGHGINIDTWVQRTNRCTSSFSLLSIHRLMRSKRLEIIIRALSLLDPRYTLDIYGSENDQEYLQELHQLVNDLGLTSRVFFHGSVASNMLPDIYCSHRLSLNMATETIDKTMLEAMTCGCYPVVTKRNACAIGIPEAPEFDTPEGVAAFVNQWSNKPVLDADSLYAIVRTRHSLTQVVSQIDAYMRKGI